MPEGTPEGQEFLAVGAQAAPPLGEAPGNQGIVGDDEDGDTPFIKPSPAELAQAENVPKDQEVVKPPIAKVEDKPKVPDFDLESHPAFKTAMEQLRAVTERAERAEQVLEQIRTGKGEAATPQPEKVDFVNLADLGEEKAREMFETDLLGFQGNTLRQAVHEVVPVAAEKAAELAVKKVMELLQQQESKTAFEREFEGFIKENPDFLTLHKSGELAKEIGTSKVINPLVAYYKLKARQAEEAGRKTGEETGREQAKLDQEVAGGRRTIKVGSQRPASTVSEDGLHPALKDTKPYGGPVQAGLIAYRARQATQRQ